MSKTFSFCISFYARHQRGILYGMGNWGWRIRKPDGVRVYCFFRLSSIPLNAMYTYFKIQSLYLLSCNRRGVYLI